MRQIRTDLAMEAFQSANRERIPGVEVNKWEESGVTATEVMVDTEEAARLLGKPIGSYLTLEAPLLREGDPDVRLALAGILGEEISRMLSSSPRESPIRSLIRYISRCAPLSTIRTIRMYPPPPLRLSVRYP